MRQILRVHDIVTIAGNYIAIGLLVLICLCFSYEVTARYVFNAPTLWANSLVAYFLCAAIFLAVPNLTRLNEHVTINILVDAMPESRRVVFQSVLRAVAAFMCFFAAWFCLSASLNQYESSIETIQEWPVPKWWVSIFIPYGFASSGLYFLRHIWDRPARQEAEGITA
jgi:TRAP-type C4-dicarboxylate transport system permease small subunit